MSRSRTRYHCPVCGRHVAGWADPTVAIECEGLEGRRVYYHRLCWEDAIAEPDPEDETT